MNSFNKIDDRITFESDYKGMTLREVALIDGNFILSCIENIPDFDITDESLDALSELKQRLLNEPEYRDLLTDSFVETKVGALDFENCNPKEIEWNDPVKMMDVEKCRQLLKKKFNR